VMFAASPAVRVKLYSANEVVRLNAPESWMTVDV